MLLLFVIDNDEMNIIEEWNRRMLMLIDRYLIRVLSLKTLDDTNELFSPI